MSIEENEVQNLTEKENKIENENTTTKIEVVQSCDDKLAKEIAQMARIALPEGWVNDTDEEVAEYFDKFINNEKNITVLLKDKEKIIGILSARPHNDAWQELQKDDPKMTQDDERYYIELAEILPEYRGKGQDFQKMLDAMFAEAEKKGFNKFSMHARVDTGLSVWVQRTFRGMITKVRRVEKWAHYNFQEPADYIEGTYEKQ